MSELGRYRKLFTRIWLHPAFERLTDTEKVLALFLLTGPQTNRIGLYRLSPAQAAEELGTSLEGFRKRLPTVCTAFGWLFDAKARVLFIPSWWRWNPPANENVMRGSLKDLNDLPPCGLVEAFARNIETIPERFRDSFMKGLSEQLPPASRNQDLVSVSEKKQEQEPRASRGSGGAARRGVTLQMHDEEKDGSEAKALAIARQTLQLTGTNGSLDYLTDAFFQINRDFNFRQVQAALNHALSERRQATASHT